MSALPETTDPTADEAWNERLAERGDADIFHSRGWCRALCEAYGFKARYLVANETPGVLPLIEVASPLTGRRGVSLPFTDYCGALADESMFRELVERALTLGRASGWKYLELRGNRAHTADAAPSAIFCGHTLDLRPGEKELFDGFKDTVRRNIRKAERSGITVEVRRDEEAAKAFYRLNCATRRLHGLPPQPWKFFDLLTRYVMGAGQGCYVLACQEARPVAGGVFLQWRDKAYYKYGASDPRYRAQRPNNLVFWEAIRYLASEGASSLCFGRTGVHNDGLRSFKLGWGPTEHRIEYFRYDLRKAGYVTAPPAVVGAHNHLFRHLPLPALRAVGTLLYRHVG